MRRSRSRSCCRRTRSSSRPRSCIAGCSRRPRTIPARCTMPACSRISRAGSDEAVALIEKSLALQPDRADCYSNLGIIYQSTGKLDAAIDAYRRAIAIDPGHANAHSNLGVLLRATGKPSEAEAAYRTAIRLDPEHIDAYTNLGILLNGLNRTRGGGGVLLQSDHAPAEAPGSAKASGARALHAGRDRRGREDLRRMARTKSQATRLRSHAGGLHRSGRAGARVERIRRAHVRQLCRQLRSEARAAVVPRPGARGGHAGGFGPPAVEAPRCAGRRLRHGALRPARGPLRASTDGRRSLRGHAGARESEARLRRRW